MLSTPTEFSVAKIGSLITLGLVFEKVALGGALKLSLSVGESFAIGSLSHLYTSLFPKSSFSKCPSLTWALPD